MQPDPWWPLQFVPQSDISNWEIAVVRMPVEHMQGRLVRVWRVRKWMGDTLPIGTLEIFVGPGFDPDHTTHGDDGQIMLRTQSLLEIRCYLIAIATREVDLANALA